MGRVTTRVEMVIGLNSKRFRVRAAGDDDDDDINDLFIELHLNHSVEHSVLVLT